MRSKTWPAFFPRIAFCSTRTKAWQDRARFSTVSASRGWKRFVRGWYFDGNRRTIRRGQPSRGRCSDIYCSPFLSLFSISFVPLVPPCLLLFFFFPLFVLSSLSQTRSTAPSFFIYVIARHSRDRCRDALAITFICAGNWAREPNLTKREIIALGYQVCIYEREKFERVVGSLEVATPLWPFISRVGSRASFDSTRCTPCLAVYVRGSVSRGSALSLCRV